VVPGGGNGRPTVVPWTPAVSDGAGRMAGWPVGREPRSRCGGGGVPDRGAAHGRAPAVRPDRGTRRARVRKAELGYCVPSAGDRTRPRGTGTTDDSPSED